MTDRFRGNDLPFYAALLCLFAGVWLKFDLGTALIVLGSVAVTLNTATAFYVTGLSATLGKK